MKTDTWIHAAHTLRETALAHAAVIMLVEKTPYETRGRGGTVRGIALRDEGTYITAHTGLFLDLTHVLDRSVEALAQDIRADMDRQWKRLNPDREISIHLDVVDLISA